MTKQLLHTAVDERMPEQFLLATIVAILCICYVQGWSCCHLGGMRRDPSAACTFARLKSLSAAKQSAHSSSSPAKRTSSKVRSTRGPRKSEKAKVEQAVKALNWRLYEVEVPLSEDPGKGHLAVLYCRWQPLRYSVLLVWCR